jgi:hypothetical protein
LIRKKSAIALVDKPHVRVSGFRTTHLEKPAKNIAVEYAPELPKAVVVWNRSFRKHIPAMVFHENSVFNALGCLEFNDFFR